MTRVVPRSELPQPPPDGAVRLTVGTRLGRYELLCPIAEGGMAQVWAAEQAGDLGFRKLIALKTIRPDFAYDASFRAMFFDEAQLASRIRHVNVVEVLDLGVEGDIVFQAMALVDGVATSEWMRAAKERLPIGGRGPDHDRHAPRPPRRAHAEGRRTPSDRIRIYYAPNATGQKWPDGVSDASSMAVFVR